MSSPISSWRSDSRSAAWWCKKNVDNDRYRERERERKSNDDILWCWESVHPFFIFIFACWESVLTVSVSVRAPVVCLCVCLSLFFNLCGTTAEMVMSVRRVALLPFSFPPQKIAVVFTSVSLFSLLNLCFSFGFYSPSDHFFICPQLFVFFSPQCGRVCLFPPGEKWKLLCCFPFCNGLPPPFFNDFYVVFEELC